MAEEKLIRLSQAARKLNVGHNTILDFLSKKQTSSAFDIAKYYDKQKHFRAATIYYNEVIRQLPGSPESEKSKKRLEELRAKYGEDALKPAAAKFAEIEGAKGGKKVAHSSDGSSGAKPQGQTNDAAPLPPPENDGSLPPPASPLVPNAPAGNSGLGSTSLSEPSTDSSSAPDATASPAP